MPRERVYLSKVAKPTKNEILLDTENKVLAQVFIRVDHLRCLRDETFIK